MAYKFHPDFDVLSDETWTDIDPSIETFDDGAVVARGRAAISGVLLDLAMYESFDIPLAGGMMTGVGS